MRAKIMTEIWKQIEGFTGYEISNMGRVKSIKRGKEKILKPSVYDNYYRVILFCDGKRIDKQIHRLVGLAFIPNPDNKPQINHIDANPSNNILSNLEWVTASENALHAFKLGRRKSPCSRLNKFGIDNPSSKKVDQRDLEGNLIKTWNSMMDAKRDGFNQKCISECCLGTQKTHKKYLWNFHESK